VLQKNQSLTDLRNALLCGLAVVIAVLLTNPICESPFNDDWSYSFTVRQMVKPGELKLNRWSLASASEVQQLKLTPTLGHLTYNGWASASLIAQAYWGLLWVKLFGFSYTTLRLSTVPLAAAAVSLCYLLARRVGLNTRFALFATLMLGLSPLYLPVAGTFMTDAPGLFFILLSMYALSRSMDAPASPPAITWLALGVIVGLIGGTGRQIVWVVPLVMAPYAAWIRRSNPLFVVCAIAGWIVVFAGVLLTLHWFNHQPYAIPESPVADELKKAIHKPAHYLLSVLALPLTTILVLLPALWGVLFHNWKISRVVIALLILLVPVRELKIHRPKYAMGPWMGNTLSIQGVMGGAELAGQRPMVMPGDLRKWIAIIVFITASILLADLILWLIRPRAAWRKLIGFFLFPTDHPPLLPAMILFALAYFTLLLPRCASDMTYDRYILPLMPCILFPLFLNYQRQGISKAPKIAWILLGIYGLFGIAITQEITALDRARGHAADLLIAKGVPRTQIDAGFEFDNETQLLVVGHLNDPRIKNPPNSFKKELGPSYVVQAVYRLEFAPAIDTITTDYRWVDYTTYLYPFHRRVYIDRYTDPWWLDPVRAKTHPPDSWHRIIKPDAAAD